MRTIEATTTINAPGAKVWPVNIAGDQYADWNPFIRKVSGDLDPGSRLTLRITPPGKRGSTFRFRVHKRPLGRARWVEDVSVRTATSPVPLPQSLPPQSRF